MRAARLAPMMFILALACGQALAAQVARVDVHGLDEAMAENVHGALSLEDATGKPVSDRRLDYLLEVAEAETRDALEPFGYYSPDIHVSTSGSRDALVVVVDVVPGTPVRVRREALGIEGAAHDDKYMQQELADFLPKVGEVFDQPTYEAGKTRITRRLAERGYFDADFASHRVEVTRADNAADVDLRWNSGDRYDMGPVTFTQAPKTAIRPQLLQKLVYWKQGEYYHQGRLDRLRKSLVSLDYFSRIDIQPHPEKAVDKEVPVEVTLRPARRSIYTVGASYGTDSGPGVILGVERRYVNMRGHKVLAQIDWADKRKTATLQYRIPAFAWLDGWYTGSLQFGNEQTPYIDSRRLEFVASRSGQVNNQLTAVVALHALRERWAYEFEHVPGQPVQYRYASLVYPSVSLDYVDADDRLYPRRALGAHVELRGGSAGNGTTFAQIHGRAQWFHGLGPQDRLIVRGELGHSFTADTVEIPPSLRFYAGGDRSIRGYNWREVGPRIDNAKGRYTFALGARNVVTSSVEYERYVTPAWGGAVFVDGGSAFNGRTLDWHTGVGFGVRWRSPVGPVRLDIGRGLNHPDSPFTIHLNIGADL